MRMNFKFLFPLVVAAIIPSIGFSLGSEYPEPGSEWLETELRANEARSQSPVGYTDLVNRAGLLGGYWVNSEDAFYYSGDKQSFEKFLCDYAMITNVVAHTVIVRHGTVSVGPPWNQSKFPEYDWALYCHPYGWLENQRPISKGKYVLWIELRIGGKISQQDRYALKIPAGVQVVYVNQDILVSDATKEKTNPDKSVEPTVP